MTASALAETYTMPDGGWICFHCGEQLKTVGNAQDHFGGNPGALAACQIKVGEERGLLMELRKAEAAAEQYQARALEAEQRVESLEYQVNGQLSEMQSYQPFRGCRSIYEIFCVYDSVEGRAIAAEERVGQLLGLIDTPHTEDWLKAVPLEAAHQIKRWGNDQDNGKTPWDWFWLIGYLSQKAAASALNAGAEKAKHHTISTAAVLLNWHRRLSGEDQTFQPGIDHLTKTDD